MLCVSAGSARCGSCCSEGRGSQRGRGLQHAEAASTEEVFNITVQQFCAVRDCAWARPSPCCGSTDVHISF